MIHGSNLLDGRLGYKRVSREHMLACSHDVGKFDSTVQERRYRDFIRGIKDYSARPTHFCDFEAKPQCWKAIEVGGREIKSMRRQGPGTRSGYVKAY